MLRDRGAGPDGDRWRDRVPKSHAGSLHADAGRDRDRDPRRTDRDRRSGSPGGGPRRRRATPGDLGSYVIDDRGSDAPWLPFASLPAVRASARDALIVRFVDRVEIGDFLAVVAGAADTGGSSPLAVRAAPVAGDPASLRVGPLPPGKWVLSVRLFRADGRGDGTTYRAFTVT